jgi:hypothetical protein
MYRPVSLERNDNIASLIKAGTPWAKVWSITECGRGQVAKIAKEIAID